MAHFAELNSNYIVLRVLVVSNNDCLNENNDESESVGITFLKNLYGNDTIWKQTSYNGNMRKNYAAIGYSYDNNKDAFIPPRPFESWNLNEDTCMYEPPIAYPTDGKKYSWDNDAYIADNTTGWMEYTL